MFNAPHLKPLARSLAACALMLFVGPAAHGQIIDLSLNVLYDIPTDPDSGGTWKLVAKTTGSGLAGLNVRLTGINAAIANEAPRGVVNGSDPAGFVFEQVTPGNYLIAQFPTFPSSGQEETAIYGVGTIENGEPGDVGPALASLTNPQDIPWALGDDFGDAAWDIAATLLSGTFADNLQPAFGVGITGRVFTTVGTSMMYGPADLATVIAITRDNLEPGVGIPDYNRNDIVDAADYVVWRKGILSLADGNNNGSIDDGDYDEWREHFGEVGSLGGSGGTSAGAVPEPATAILLFFALFYGPCTRPRRSASPLVL